MSKADVVFRRINGHIIPIKAGSRGSTPKKALGAAAAGAAIGYSAGKLKKPAAGQHKGLAFASTALAVAGGVISALPFGGGLKGFAKGTAIGLGVDAVSTAANAASVANMKGGVKAKAKTFAKQEAVNIAAGYTAFGVTLLGNPSVRKKLAEWGAKIIGKVAL